MIRGHEREVIGKQGLRNFKYDHPYDRYLFDKYVEEPTPKRLLDLYEMLLKIDESIIELEQTVVDDTKAYAKMRQLSEAVKKLTCENAVLKFLLHVLDRKTSHIAGIYARERKEFYGDTGETRTVLNDYFEAAGYDRRVIEWAFDNDGKYIEKPLIHLVK